MAELDASGVGEVGESVLIIVSSSVALLSVLAGADDVLAEVASSCVVMAPPVTVVGLFVFEVVAEAVEPAGSPVEPVGATVDTSGSSELALVEGFALLLVTVVGCGVVVVSGLV